MPPVSLSPGVPWRPRESPRVDPSRGEKRETELRPTRAGARPLGRLIQTDIKNAFADELLFGKLEKGGKALVDAIDGRLVFKYE